MVGGQVLSFGSLKTVMRKNQMFTLGSLNSGKIRRRNLLSQEEALPGESVEKEMVKKMEGFSEYSLFKYRQCEEKVNRVRDERMSGLQYNNSKIKT